MSETKLLPCPFCGMEPYTALCYIVCANVDCPNVVRANTPAAWNARAPNPRIAAADEMAKALEEAVSIFDIYGAGMFRGPCERAIRSSLAAYNALK